MTSAHILYIPIIFSLGLLSGTLLSSSSKTPFEPKNLGNKPKQIKGRTLLGSFFIFITVFIGTHFFNVPRSSKAVEIALQGAEIFDKKPSFSSEQVYNRIASFPIDGIWLYKQFTYTIDVLFPITLFAFLILLSLYVTRRLFMSRKVQIAFLLIPTIWFASDMLENSIVYYLLSTFPAKNKNLAGILGYVTTVKFTLLLLSIAVPTLVRTFEKTFIRKLKFKPTSAQ